MKTISYAQMIDHTNLKPYITSEDWKVLCREAREYQFKTVAINNAGIEYCRDFLEGSSVLVDGAISFPLGQSTWETKVFETKDAISRGAGEVDYVINLSELKMGHWDYLKREMQEITFLCRNKGILCKVIFETCYLTNEEKKRLCQTANEVMPDFIKTSTGFGTGGATVEDVVLMRKYADLSIQIKASGGIRDGKSFLAMVNAGAARIGTSAGVSIMKELS